MVSERQQVNHPHGYSENTEIKLNIAMQKMPSFFRNFLFSHSTVVFDF